MLRDLFRNDPDRNGRGSPSGWGGHVRCLVNGFRVCPDVDKRNPQSDANIINRAMHANSQKRFTSLINRQERETNRGSTRGSRRGVKRSRRSRSDDSDDSDGSDDEGDC